MLLKFELFSVVIIFVQHFSSVKGVTFSHIKQIFHNVPKVSIRVGIGSISSNIVSLSNRISKDGLFNELSSKYNIQEPWNAPKFVWSWAWKLHTIMLPILHYFDKCCPQDTFVNLSVLWWKSISGNNRHGPLYDYGIAYDFLPPFMRIMVSYPLCLLYPKLHHQNVALRTLYLDEVIEELLNNDISALPTSSSLTPSSSSTTTAPTLSSTSLSSSPKTHVLTFGAGFDTRSLRLALQHHNHTSWHEFDLPRVIQQKQAVLNRYLLRRQRFYNRIINKENCLMDGLIPKLYSIDMNNISSVVESLHTALSSLSAQKGDNIIFITEASLLYLNQSVVAPLLASCMKTAEMYVNAQNIKYCFADRFPLPCTDFMSSTTTRLPTNSTTTAGTSMTAVTHRNSITTSSSIYDIDTEVEKNEAVTFFHSIDMNVDTWQIKPGRARHMGVASIVL